MISVEIKINNKRIHKITAVQIRMAYKGRKKNCWRVYQLNCGCELTHDRLKGALCMMVQMAGHAMLCKKQSIKENRRAS